MLMGLIKAELDGLTERSNLPMEAFTGSVECFDICNSWLSTAEEWEQATAIKVWFEERYFDPTDESRLSPHETYREGGPFQPGPIVRSRFSAHASKVALDGVIDELLFSGGDRWAKRLIRVPSTYDEDFAIFVEAYSAPLQNTVQRVGEIRELLNLPSNLVRNLAFGAAITALESFLWETMVFWVENDESVVRSLITTHPAFKDQPIKLGTIFDKRETLTKDILGFMQGVVWHNWDNVGTLYKYGLSLKKLNLDNFTPAVLKRHDIVHRSGMTKAGEHVVVTSAEIIALCEQITIFAASVASQLQKDFVDVPF
jgi:hypothetical protein